MNQRFFPFYPCPAWLNFLVRVVLSGVFLCAGIEKILEPRQFADAIAAYQLLPEGLVNLVALVLPMLEVVLAVMLFWPLDPVRKLARIGMGVLLGVFLVGLIQALARGIVLDCGCFGKSEIATKSGMVWAIARDMGLLGLLFLAARERKTQLKNTHTERSNLK